MKRLIHPILACLILLCSQVFAQGPPNPPLQSNQVLLPSFFSDGMVLQREKGAKVWGYTLPFSPVTVQFAGRTLQATADENGRFEVVLNNLLASAIGRNLIITTGTLKTTIADVLVGEVWMGAGQSNMQFPFSFLPSPENDAEVATANDPLLRFYLPTLQARKTEQAFISGDWIAAVPGEMPDLPALPYYIAKRLRAELGVPVAFIQCAWGGQPIQGFISEEKLLTFPHGIASVTFKNFIYQQWEAYQEALADWQANPVGPAPEAPGDDPNFEGFLAGQIYNGMVAPLAGYGLRGIFFYQGEANSFSFSPSSYQPFLEALVSDWRASWGEELPFYYMQLPNFASADRSRWVDVQNEQRLALGNLTSVGMTVGNDIGDPSDIHPINKSEFAARIARWPLANEYGQTTLIPSGPLFTSAAVSGSNVTIQFDYSKGLATRNTLAPQTFQVRGATGPWTNATASIIGETVVVSAASVPSPRQLRYAWSNNPTAANLVNSAGLPASVFTINLVPVAPPIMTATASPTNEGLIALPVLLTLSRPAEGGETVSFTLERGGANPEEDYEPRPNGAVIFEQGQTTQTVIVNLVDDTVIEPSEVFTIEFTLPTGLELAQTELALTIINDDSVLDDYGFRFGLDVPQRMILSDDDGDGIGLAIEYAFNLNPTIAETPDYVSGVTIDIEGEPFGMPAIVTEAVPGGTDIKYVFARRTDSFPKVEYFVELSADAVNFAPTTPTKITTLTDHWEEVEVLIGGPSKPGLTNCFARVRVVGNDLNGDGF